MWILGLRWALRGPDGYHRILPCYLGERDSKVQGRHCSDPHNRESIWVFLIKGNTHRNSLIKPYTSLFVLFVISDCKFCISCRTWISTVIDWWQSTPIMSHNYHNHNHSLWITAISWKIGYIESNERLWLCFYPLQTIFIINLFIIICWMLWVIVVRDYKT